MNALWGLTTALCWGSADFIARFTGRALGHQLALFGMLSVGAVLLDAGAYLALLLGSHGENNEISAVIASTFSAVTVLLALMILREPMSGWRWAGIVSIICGVAVLSVH